MHYILESFGQALVRIVHLDPYVLDAVRVSLVCSVLATIFGALIGLPIGALLGTTRFWGKRTAVVAVDALMATPTVVIGLLVYAFLSRRGPLGPMGLLFTPSAIILGEALLIIPIVASLTRSALEQLSPSAAKTAATLGIVGRRKALLLLREAKTGVAAGVVAAAARAISEVGVAMMLGGNIAGYTRTMTTAIALETAKGTFEVAMALGMILIAIAYMANLGLQLLQSGVSRGNAGVV
jgi:tungstate transport system permease protein